MHSHDNYKPQDLRAGKRDVIKTLQQAKLIRLYSLIVDRSACGAWTSYEQCRSAGIGRPRKRLSDLIEVHGVDVKKRTLADRTLEFCV